MDKLAARSLAQLQPLPTPCPRARQPLSNTSSQLLKLRMKISTIPGAGACHTTRSYRRCATHLPFRRPSSAVHWLVLAVAVLAVTLCRCIFEPPQCHTTWRPSNVFKRQHNPSLNQTLLQPSLLRQTQLPPAAQLPATSSSTCCAAAGALWQSAGALASSHAPASVCWGV
jgi:hypothetical protein